MANLVVICSKLINFPRLQFLCMDFFIYNIGIFFLLFVHSITIYQASTLY